MSETIERIVGMVATACNCTSDKARPFVVATLDAYRATDPPEREMAGRVNAREVGGA